MKYKDLTGKRFGRFICVADAGRRNGRAIWKCLCDCGEERLVACSNLINGHIKSCGCFGKENPSGRTHGLSGGSHKTPLYSVWLEMRDRCNNPRNKAYKNYGGRGICFGSEWNDFSCFHKWAFSNGYRKGLTIERKNNDEGYYPENCRWATRKEQAQNFRRNRLITFNGITKPLGQWAEFINMRADALRGRLNRGWSAERALTTPKL